MDEPTMRHLIAGLAVDQGGLRKAARAWGVSPAYLSDVLNGRRAPGPAILKPLGYKKVVTVAYQPIR